jgi:hypothetical protein
LTNIVPTSRTISTTSPLTGGGDLSANRTLAVSAGSTSAAGVLQLTDSTSSTSTTTAATPNAVKTTYDYAVTRTPKMKQVSGSYMRTPVLLQAGTTAGHQRTYYVPIYVDSTTTFDRLAIATSGTFAGTATVRLGIYNDSAGVPTTLILDAGTLSATAANTNYEITISQSLNAGFYWLAFCQQGTAPTVGSYVGAPASGSAYQSYLMPITVSPNGASWQGYSQTSVTGAFANASFPALASTIVHVWVRAA